MNIRGVQKQLREFAVARDWKPFHSPKNLAMALMVEVAELLELFQWLTTEQSHTLTQDATDKEKVADEIADVMLYLLQIADCTGVDLEEAVQKKIVKNAAKYPAKYPEAVVPKAKVHVLVDWENVQPDAPALQALEPAGTDIWIFHAPVQYKDAQKHQKTYGTNSVTLVERTGRGKNALDFQLSYYAGYLMARQPEARFVVVSNDKGYEPMLEHARKLEFQAQRLGYCKPLTAPKSVVKPLTRTSKVDQPIPPLFNDGLPSPSAAQIACRTRSALVLLPQLSRPRTWDGLLAICRGLIAESVGDKRTLAEKACALLQLRGTVRTEGDTGQIKYGFADEQLLLQDLPVVTAPKLESSLVDVPLPMQAVSLETAPAKTKLSPAKKPTVQATALSKPNTKKQVQGAVKKVQVALAKMGVNAPKKRDGLMNLIRSHLSQLPGGVSAEKVCGALQSLKTVKLSKQGLVSYVHQESELFTQPKVKKQPVASTSTAKFATMRKNQGKLSSPVAAKASAAAKKKVQRISVQAAT